MKSKSRTPFLLALLCLIVAGATFGVTMLLINIAERKREARLYPAKLTEVEQSEPDSKKWGESFQNQYDAWLKTSTNYGRTKYGGSEPFQHVEENPRLKRLFAGYAFAVDYREERGHAWTITDVKNTERTKQFKQPLTCMTCKSSQVPRKMDEYGGPAAFYKQKFAEHADEFTEPIGCADCHDAKTMNLRISRPAFREAMEARGIDLSKATRQEMRSYVCGQCHVEYHFKGEGKYLTFPWTNGLNFDEIERFYEEQGFTDWTHAETRAKMLKAQHPEFETWSTGIHARSGVACADCHMPYQRVGSVKVTDHWIQSPMQHINRSCQNCHRWSEAELAGRVEAIQDRTAKMLERAELAIIALIDDIKGVMAEGATDERLESARQFHREAQFRWDFIAAENSMGFHSPQETLRILGESIDLARQGQLEVAKIREALHTPQPVASTPEPTEEAASGQSAY